MADIEKVIKGLECCNKPNNHDDCPYNGECHYNVCTHKLLDDALELLIEQDEIISELLKVGYPHGYENEEPWIVDYMQLITEVVRKAVHLRNGTE